MTESLHENLWAFFSNNLKHHLAREKSVLTPSVLSEKLTLQQMSMMLFFPFSLSNGLAQIQALE